MTEKLYEREDRSPEFAASLVKVFFSKHGYIAKIKKYEEISKLTKIIIPVQAGMQNSREVLDSNFRWNDGVMVLKLPQW